MLRQLFSRTLRKNNLFKYLSDGVSAAVSEQTLTQILVTKFPKSSIKVEDISGGCGAMFEIHVKSSEFKNLSMVKQHQMVNQALKQEVKLMHGIRIFTEAE